MRLAYGIALWFVLAAPTFAMAASTAPSPASSSASPLEVLKYELSANQDRPDLCFLLSQTIARQPSVPLESFISIDPTPKLTATPRNNRLCVMGLEFRGNYTVSLKAGLPGVSGVLAKDVQYRISVPDRPPEMGFAASQDDVLPRLNGGVPIRSVNVPKIAIAIFHINDRDLLAGPFDKNHGEKVWQGTIESKGAPNSDTLTVLKTDATIGALKPGLYVALAWPDGMPTERAIEDAPVQYFTVSDLGLTAYRGPSSLMVAVRALSSAQAVTGIEVALMARNNRELGRVRTDANGFARFDSALLHGRDGDRPVAVFAYGAAGEFNKLYLDQSVEGWNAIRGPTAFFYPDRSRYSLGDHAMVTVLFRNERDAAVAKQALTFKITRPDGSLGDVLTVNDQGGGSYGFAVPFADMPGPWRIDAYADTAGPIVGSTMLNVDREESSSLTVFASSDSAVIDPLQPSPIEIRGQYASGQPAVGAPGELRITLDASPTPFPSFGEFSFGLAEERFEPVRLEPTRFNTDMTGAASLPLKFASLPKTTKPLEASIQVSLFDASGYAVRHNISIPVTNQNLLLGIKAAGLSPQAAIFGDGSSSHFDVIALSPDGARQEKPDAGWEIVREEFVPAWYRDGARFAYRPTLKSTHVAGGIVNIPAGTPAGIEATLPFGRYRIEVFDPKGEAISSTRFRVGSAPSTMQEQPDSIAIKTGKPFYAAGETADIFIKPPYESDVLLISSDPDIRDSIVQHIPAAGATLHLDLPRDAVGDLQLTATALAAQQVGSDGLPRRAIGTGALSIDPQSRRLDVHLGLPEKIVPQQTSIIPVSVGGAGEDAVFIAIAATDETASESGTADNADISAPSNKGLDVFDVYGRIVTPLGLSNSPLSNLAQTAPANPTAELTATLQPRKKTVSLYSGIVALDKTGKASVPLSIPDYQGKLHIRALAWSAGKTGQADAALEVHFPLSVELAAPKALFPEDHADLTLAIDNIDGPRGEYRIKLSAEGAVSLPDEITLTANLAEHEQRSQPVGIQAHGAGEGGIKITVQGPDGIDFERRIPIEVRTPIPAVSRHATIILKPAAIFAIDPAISIGLRPETIGVSLAIGGAGTVDLYGLAQELGAGDFGSAEQIIGRATPYLASAPLRQTLGLNAPGLLNDLVRRLISLQRPDGGFSQWGLHDGDPRLTAYAIDFFGRAKAAGAIVPNEHIRLALDFLTLYGEPKAKPPLNAGDSPVFAQAALENAAYIQEILAANGRSTIFQLRYFSDRFVNRMRSPLALGLVAAAYAALNEKETADGLFTQALALPSIQADNPTTDLRDQAMLAVLMAESGAASPSLILAQSGKLAAGAASRRQFGTEEATWLFQALSAQAASHVKLKFGDGNIDQSAPFGAVVHPGEPALEPIKNMGDMPLQAVVTVSGIPVQNETRDGTGFELQRWFFDTAGKPVDPAACRQNDLLVVVLTGRFAGEGEAHPLLIDPIPAGWRIEAAMLTDPANRYPWLKDLTGASHIAADNGRYLATPVLSGDKREFKLAYVARAVTRGQFTLPGSVIFDMAQPALSARGVNSRVKVDPAS